MFVNAHYFSGAIRVHGRSRRAISTNAVAVVHMIVTIEYGFHAWKLVSERCDRMWSRMIMRTDGECEYRQVYWQVQVAKRMYAFGLNLHTDAYIHNSFIEKKIGACLIYVHRNRTTNTKIRKSR